MDVLAAIGLGLAGAAAPQVSYVAPPACPPAAVFWAAVDRRLPRPRDADVGLEVSVERIGARLRGRVVVRAPGRAAAVRELQGDSCDELVRALAFVAAVALDPMAHAAPAEPAPPRVSPLPRSAPRPVPPQTRDPAPLARAAAPAPAAPPAAPPPPGPPPRLASAVVPSIAAAEAAPPERGAGFAVGLDTVATWAPSPSPLFAGGPFLRWASSRPSVFSPLLRVGVFLGGAASAETAAGGARFTAALGRAELCPFRLIGSAHLDVRPCVGLEAGVVQATGEAGPRVERAVTERRPWLAVPVVLAGELALGRVVVAARVGLTTAVTRDRYEFVLQDGVRDTIHEVPRVAPTAAVAIGWSLR